MFNNIDLTGCKCLVTHPVSQFSSHPCWCSFRLWRRLLSVDISLQRLIRYALFDVVPQLLHDLLVLLNFSLSCAISEIKRRWSFSHCFLLSKVCFSSFSFKSLLRCCGILQDMICAIAELESDRQILVSRYNKKTKDTTLGIMQILPKTAEWLNRYR